MIKHCKVDMTIGQYSRDIEDARREGRLAVAEWLKKQLVSEMADPDAFLHFALYGRDFEALLEGRIPEEEA